MRIKNWLVILFAAGLLVSIPSQSLAWGRRPQPEKIDREEIMDRIERKLELTKEQQEQFKAHREKEQQQLKAHLKEMETFGDKFKSELEKDQPDRQALYQQIKIMNQKRLEMEIQRVDSLLELRKMLTPKQRELFKEMTKEQERRGPGGSPRPW